MPLTSTSARRGALWTAAVAAGLVAALVWWIAGRRTAALDVDEGAYLATALRASHDAGQGFVSDFVHLYFYEPSSNAPLLSWVTIPFHLLFGTTVEASLLAQIPFLLILAGATFVLAEPLAGRRWAVVAAAAATLNPLTVDYAASYHFALPSAALFTASLAALVRSDRLARWGWALAWGALLGLALLARTMMLALVPGLVVAAVVSVAVAADRDRWVRLAAGLGMAFVVAAPWYVANWSIVFDYLTGYGYGDESAAFGDDLSPLGPAFWGRVPSSILRLLFLPLTLLLLAGLVLAAVWAVNGLRRAGVRRWVESSTRSGHLLVGVSVLWGYAALTSSQNNGTAFELPLVPALCVLAVAGYARLPWPVGRRVVAVAFAVVLGGIVVAKSADLPPFTTSVASSVWVDGRSRSQRYVEDAGYPPSTDLTPEASAAVRWMRGRDPERVVVAYVPGDPLLNVGLLRSVAQREHHQDLVAFITTEPDLLGERAGIDPNFLVTVAGVESDDALSIRGDVDAIEAVAADEGFVLEETATLPEGRELRIWYRA